MKKAYFLMLLLASFLGYSQVGVNTSTPSSTLDVAGSIEGNYKEITASSYTVLNNDYHLSFSGTSASTFTLPSVSTADDTANDFRGRKYFIKNNSTTSNLVINPASGGNLRIGGTSGNVSTVTINPGSFALVTANGNNGWDLDVITNQPTESWKLSYTALNGFINTPQTLNSSYTTINDCSVTVTIPSGITSSKVTLNFTGWGEILASAASTGSIRFQLVQTGTVNNLYESIMMSSWSTSTSVGSTGVRYNFPIAYTVDNLSPGTYTFSIQAKYEGEFGSVTRRRVYGVQSMGQVFVKN